MRVATSIPILAIIAAALAFHVQTVRAEQVEGCGVIHFAPDVIDLTPPEQNHCPVKTDLQEIIMAQASVCIEDFCGYTSPGHFHTTFSADWFPAEQLTHFTGEWCDCPPMPSPTQPTEADVWNWARKHSGYFAHTKTDLQEKQ